MASYLTIFHNAIHNYSKHQLLRKIPQRLSSLLAKHAVDDRNKPPTEPIQWANIPSPTLLGHKAKVQSRWQLLPRWGWHHILRVIGLLCHAPLKTDNCFKQQWRQQS